MRRVSIKWGESTFNSIHFDNCGLHPKNMKENRKMTLKNVYKENDRIWPQATFEFLF